MRLVFSGCPMTINSVFEGSAEFITSHPIRKK